VVKDKKQIYLLLFIGVFVISFSGILIKVSTAPPLIIAFFRMLYSILILTPFFLFKKKSQLKYFLDFRPALVGFLLAIHFFLWFTAFKYTSVANSVIFIAMQPLFSVILEYFFAREDLNKSVIRGILLALVGSLVISIGDIHFLFTRLFGDLLALTAAFFAASYLFVGRTLRDEIDYFPYLYIVYCYTTLFLGLTVLIRGIDFTVYGSVNHYIFLALALGPTLIGHSVLNYSVRYIPSSLVSITILGEPILTTFLAWILLGDVISFYSTLGGLFIIYGIYAATVKPVLKSKLQKRISEENRHAN